MKHSYSDIVNQLTEVAEAHPQVASVDNGTEMEFDVKKYESFPRVFLRVNNSSYSGRFVYNFSILVLGLVNSDGSDKEDTMNRTHAIVEDLLSQYNYMELIKASEAQILPLTNYQDTVTAGWLINIPVYTEKGLECFT